MTNAQRRRAAKVSHPDAPKPPGFVSRTLRRLQAQAQHITTRSQFEEILANIDVEHQAAVRRMLEPMLKPDLPCCGPGQLMRVAPNVDVAHTARCPTRNLVRLT